MKRLFAAIKIIPDETFHHVYLKLKRQLKNEKIKWVDLQNIHVTLKFFGETPDQQIPDIISTLHNARQTIKPFTLKIHNIGIFGSSYKPRVLWFGIAENEELMKLGMSIFKCVGDIGFVRDRQNFRPHLTIGRIKYIEDKKRLNEIINPIKDIEIQQNHITEMHLYESILKPTGPVYSVIETFSLK